MFAEVVPLFLFFQGGRGDSVFRAEFGAEGFHFPRGFVVERFHERNRFRLFLKAVTGCGHGNAHRLRDGDICGRRQGALGPGAQECPEKTGLADGESDRGVSLSASGAGADGWSQAAHIRPAPGTESALRNVMVSAADMGSSW